VLRSFILIVSHIRAEVPLPSIDKSFLPIAALCHYTNNIIMLLLLVAIGCANLEFGPWFKAEWVIVWEIQFNHVFVWDSKD